MGARWIALTLAGLGGLSLLVVGLVHFASSGSAGARCEFHRGVSIIDFLPTQPPNSVDSMQGDIDPTGKTPSVIALVIVPAALVSDRPRFETTFTTDARQSSVRRWDGARKKSAGDYRAIFILPVAYTGAETTVLADK